MTDSEVGADTDEARAAARIAQRVSGALDGVTPSFETTADLLDEAAVEAKINGAFSKYFIDHKQDVQTVEKNGTTIAHNVEAAAQRISDTDHEAEEGFDHRPLTPHDAGVQDYDTTRLLREINRFNQYPA
ncbi:type VII secretion target [Nocardiopsis sp. NPDC006938]|uniref:type VII secretion target n=1 Tax=Nocardiopsis sp. NPDC006938 TaxID=3364337 RepID=UPI0036A841B3